MQPSPRRRGASRGESDPLSGYWATVCATFALGTATGDLTAYTLHLGFLASGTLFAVVIAVPAIAHRFAALNAVAVFWFAYIITPGHWAPRSPTGWGFLMPWGASTGAGARSA
jgi:hypothetical protein